MKINELLDEGWMDYLRGAGRATGQKVGGAVQRNIIQPSKDIYQAGKLEHLKSEVVKTVKELGYLVLQMSDLKKKLNALQPPTPTNEGITDFFKGAARAGAQKVGGAIQRNVVQPMRDIHQSGQVASLKGDMQKNYAQQKKLFAKLAQLTNRFGEDGFRQVEELIHNTWSGTAAGVISSRLRGFLNNQG